MPGWCQVGQNNNSIVTIPRITPFARASLGLDPAPAVVLAPPRRLLRQLPLLPHAQVLLDPEVDTFISNVKYTSSSHAKQISQDIKPRMWVASKLKGKTGKCFALPDGRSFVTKVADGLVSGPLSQPGTQRLLANKIVS